MLRQRFLQLIIVAVVLSLLMGVTATASVVPVDPPLEGEVEPTEEEGISILISGLVGVVVDMLPIPAIASGVVKSVLNKAVSKLFDKATSEPKTYDSELVEVKDSLDRIADTLDEINVSVKNINLIGQYILVIIIFLITIKFIWFVFAKIFFSGV